MENKIKIHEFSTGIEVKGTQTNWESVGFTGEYMNRTLDKIPQAVLNSIANREFALAEGVDRAEPAIVGRVVRGYEESWSVVAVVIRGRDDRGRGVSLYRYFLRQGDTGIETILRWMKQRDQQGLSSEFDPFDKMAIGQPHKVDVSSITTHGVDLQNFEKELGQSPPIIVPNNKPCTALVLNQITRELPESNGDRSWAYKVAMLERPESFQVIYPADAKAETIIKEFFKRPRSALMIPSGASGIKAAIKAIIKGNVVNLEHIQTLENTLGNSQLDDNYWISILDRTAVSQGVKENIENPRYVRFLTLKAMLVPTFLPDFMKLLTHSKEWERHYDTSLSLQELMLKKATHFTNHFPKLSEYLKRGICYTIDYLVDEPKILKQSQLLLTKPGFWSQLYKESLSKELENVLGLMGKKGQNLQSLNTQYPQWSSLLGKINTFWYPPERTDNKYKSLAELFEKVETAKLAAIFYQIAEGSVPKKLFDSIWPSDKKSESTRLFNKKIDRKKNVGDRISSVFNDVQTNFVSSPREAIRKLINNSVKCEYLTTLNDALDDSNDNKSLKSWCDKLGAKGALDKNSYSERIIKLLTLKAMLIPDVLPLFLKWLAESKKSEKDYSVSQNLQEEILRKVPDFTQDCSKLSKQLKCGICIVIHRLVNDRDILEQSKWLLTKPGLWSKVYQESLSGKLENDIELIRNYINGIKGLQFQVTQYPQWGHISEINNLPLQVTQYPQWDNISEINNLPLQVTQYPQCDNISEINNLLLQVTQYPKWIKLLKDIHKLWLLQPQPRDDRYLTLGDLFKAVKTPKLAQVFYEIGGDSQYIQGDSSEAVDKQKLAQVSHGRGNEATESSIPENKPQEAAGESKGRVEKGNTDTDMSKKMVLILLIIVFLAGLTLGGSSVYLLYYPEIEARQTGKNNDESSGKTEGNPEKSGRTSLSPKNQDNYNKTDKAIERISKNLTPNIEKLAQENTLPIDIPFLFYNNKNDINKKGIVTYCLKKIIKLSEKIEYSKITENDAKWQEFSDAIKKYQEDKSPRLKKIDGVISVDKNTQKVLQEDILNQCLNPKQQDN
jgi:hypothetical protein